MKVNFQKCCAIGKTGRKEKYMKYIKDIDSGEIFPIEDNNEQNINIPEFIKDDFPEIKVNYSGENGANDIILDLSKQLKEEKNNKTIYHKFPIIKIICAVMITAFIVVSSVFGVRYATSVNFEPITIEYAENTKNEKEQETQKEEESEQMKFINELSKKYLLVYQF